MADLPDPSPELLLAVMLHLAECHRDVVLLALAPRPLDNYRVLKLGGVLVGLEKATHMLRTRSFLPPPPTDQDEREVDEALTRAVGEGPVMSLGPVVTGAAALRQLFGKETTDAVRPSREEVLQASPGQVGEAGPGPDLRVGAGERQPGSRDPGVSHDRPSQQGRPDHAG